ncbi:MAG: hypothetical protein E7485_05730 [Ruminococcaceae bacterium]|nr:hypothetical protein [Oscillospiraceae bacterium]
MLRRRIFSAAMASVMALSTVAVVAQAEEKTLADYKAELDALLNGNDDLTWQCGDDWRTGELLDYGAKQTEKMLDALDAAEAILLNADSQKADYAAAYYMVTGVRKHLYKKTYEQLQDLIKQAESYTTKNNILNEEINDNIYDTAWYESLTLEIEDAKSFTELDTVPDITEAWDELNAIVVLEPIKKLNRVSKEDFRRELLKYEAIAADVNKYETWRRSDGSVTFGKAYNDAMAQRDDIVAQYNVLDGYKGVKETTFPEIYAGYTLCIDTYNAYKGWAPDSATTRGSNAAVKKLINDYNGPLVATFMVDVLGDESASSDNTTLVGAIKTAGATPTFYVDTNDDNVGDKLWEITYDATVNTKIIAAKAIVSLDKNVYVPVDENGKWIVDEAVLTEAPKKNADGEWVTQADVLITLENHNGEGGDAVIPNRYLALTKASKFDLANMIKIDVTEFAGAKAAADSHNRASDGASLDVELSYALTLADAYLKGVYTELDPKTGAPIAQYAAYTNGSTGYLDNHDIVHVTDGDYNDIIDVIDEIGVISPSDYAKNQTPEWTLVYRYLKYALEDNFKGAKAGEGTHIKRADIEKLIGESEALLNATGDAAIFNPTHVALLHAVKEAREWVAASYTNKKYEDGKEFEAANGEVHPSSDELWGGIADLDAGTDFKPVFDSTYYSDSFVGLNVAYTALDAEYKALKISVDDVYKLLGETAVKVDAGELNDSAAMQDALTECGRWLSQVDDITYYLSDNDADGWVNSDGTLDSDDVTMGYFDNAAFNEVRELLPLNRIVTGAAKVEAVGGYVTTVLNDSHANAYAAYQALDAAVTANAPGEGDGEGGEGGASGTYTGNAEWSLDDASMMIADAFTGMNQTKGDYDKDGDTDLDDVSAIIRDALAGII